jgi:hypothetical protein
VLFVKTAADDPGEKTHFYITTRLSDSLGQVANAVGGVNQKAVHARVTPALSVLCQLLNLKNSEKNWSMIKYGKW